MIDFILPQESNREDVLSFYGEIEKSGGGHIGYAVRPSERRRGLATRMLAGLGAGVVTGLAGLSDAVIITPMLGYNLKIAVGTSFANKCEIKKLNRIVGCVLLVLGAVTLVIKLV